MKHNYRPSCVCSNCAAERENIRAHEYAGRLTVLMNQALRRLNLHLWVSRPGGFAISREDWIAAGCKKPLHKVSLLVIGATR
jgi:hypothetical protein